MAIIVTNPSTVQFTGAPTDVQDPAANPIDTGFTEELANAMQPVGQVPEGLAKSPKPLDMGEDEKLNDLQILPADVLMNAVGEANFAFAAKDTQLATEAIPNQAASETATDASLSEAIDPLQASEMAAAALAAQLAAQPIVDASQAPVTAEGVGAILSNVANSAPTLDSGMGGTTAAPVLVDPSSLVAQSASNAVAPLQSGENISLTPGQVVNAELNLNPNPNPTRIDSQVVVTQATEAKALSPLVAADNAETAVRNAGVAQTLDTAPIALATQTLQETPALASNLIDVKTTDHTVQTQVAKSEDVASNAEVQQIAIDATQSQQLPKNLDVNPSNIDIQNVQLANSSPEDLLNAATVTVIPQGSNTLQTNGSDKDAIALAVNQVSPEQSSIEPALLDSEVSKLQATEQTAQSPLPQSTQESAFKFDAKLGNQETNSKVAPSLDNTLPASLGGVKGQTLEKGVLKTAGNAAKSSLPATTASIAETQREIERVDELRGDDISPNLNSEASESQLFAPSLWVSPVKHRSGQDTTTSNDSLDSEQLPGVVSTNLDVQNFIAESSSSDNAVGDVVQSTAKTFEDVASTFVSSLVGGPQRPITTVMDWVALKPQEPPRPVMPHELRLDAGAVQVEIQRMVKQGGGHVVMELTPPDQSKFTIELKLDEKGGAYLKVEGISDSTKTRLEQSAPQLQEQFQQMGLNLQLDMRQNRDSSQTGASDWTANEPGFDNTPSQEVTPQNSRAVAAERARKNNGGQVYLYA